MSNTLTISILADAANAERGIKGVSNELTGLSGVAAKVGVNLKTLAAGFVGFEALSFLTDRFKQAGQAVQDQERLLNQTNAALKSTGNTAGITADEIVGLSESLERKSLIDAEAIQSGQNLLLTFTNIKNEAGAGNDIFNQTSQIMVDLATAMGTDTSSAATLLGKALNDPIKGLGALSKAGVQFTEEQKEQIRVLVESGDIMGAQKIILGELSTQFGGSGAASADTFAGSIKRLNDDIDAIFEAVVSSALPGLEFLADGVVDLLPLLTGIGSAIGDVVGVFTDLPTPVLVAVGALTAVALLKGPVSSAFQTMALQALYMRDSVSAASLGMGTMRTAGAGVVGLLGGPWGIAIAAGITGLSLLTMGLFSSGDAAADAAGFQEDLAAALEESNGVIDENVRALAAQKAADTKIGDSNLLQVSKDLGIPLSLVTDAILGNADAYDEVSGRINEYYDASLLAENAGDAGMTELAENGRLAEEALGELTPVMGQVQTETALVGEATSETGAAIGEASGETSEYVVELEAAQEALSEAKKLTDQFKLSLDLLTGASVSMAQAESAVNAAVTDATTAVSELDGAVFNTAGSFDLTTEAGRAGFDALTDITDASNTYISTMISQGRSAQDVKAKDAELRASFIQSAITMGANAEEAENLANQYYGIPSDRYTRIDSNVAEVSSQVATLAQRIENIPEYKRVSIAATVQTFGFGSLMGFAEGGYTGPGGKYDVAGVVHAGEYVITADQVNGIGLQNLRALYGGDMSPKTSYATGGYAVGGVGNTYNLNVTATPGMSEEEAGALFHRAIKKADRAGML